MTPSRRKAGIAAVLLCILFIGLSLPWITRLGMQTDEVIFAGAIFPPFNGQFSIRIFHHSIPLMVMSYVGALKSLVWAAIFKFWAPSAASVRIPAVLLSSLSIWLVYALLARTLGTRAGLAAAALLATDPIYILYSRYDHGPVVIQHLCQLGAVVALVRFHQQRREIWLAAGFLALGLGMWEKAVFAWMLSGMLVAALAVFWPQVRGAWSRRNLAIALVAFSVGAFPLILYNIRHKLDTFRSNTVWSTDDFRAKAGLLWRTLQGDAIFGAMTRDVWEGPFREPATATERATLAIADGAGLPRQTLLGYLAVSSLLLLPLVWRTAARKAALFVLIAMAVAWIQMALIKGAGGGAHHTILLWPLPAIGVGAVLAAVSQRVKWGGAFVAALVVLAAGANLLVLNTYYATLLRNGGTSSWSDAMYPAFNAIHQMPKDGVCTVDWGFFDTLRMFEEQTQLCAAPDVVDDASQTSALRLISHPGYVFLTHTQGSESFEGITGRLLQFAEGQGFNVTNRQVFADSNGRPTVEIFQFTK